STSSARNFCWDLIVDLISEICSMVMPAAWRERPLVFGDSGISVGAADAIGAAGADVAAPFGFARAGTGSGARGISGRAKGRGGADAFVFEADTVPPSKTEDGAPAEE